jgi:phosphoribosylanthranilate isomerase
MRYGTRVQGLVLGAALLTAPLGWAQQRPQPVPQPAEVITDPTYVIGPDDVLSILFWRDRDTSADVMVRPDGKITLPLLNDIAAAGLTPEELRVVVQAAAEQYFEEPHVAVMVTPTAEELRAAVSAGFARFQIHHEADVAPTVVAAWARVVGRERLWLAPRLPPGEELASAWLESAQTFLIDTYHAEGYGGSGRTGDWGRFAGWRQAHPDHTWILAGGLRPDNVSAALEQSGAGVIDVGSGVEAAPGVKDAAKLQAWAAALRAWRSGK